MRQEGREALRIDGGRRERDHSDDDGEKQRREDELHPPRDAHAETVRDERRDEDRERDDRDHRSVDPRHGDDVLAAQHGDDRSPGADAEHEPVARHARGRVAERAAHVAGDSAGVWVAGGQHGEGHRERHRQQDDGDHCHDARRPRDCAQPRQHEEAGAEDRGDVERCPLDDADAPLRRGIRRSRGIRSVHASSLRVAADAGWR